ncbi:glycosyltransferase involved in cell wall biosynthesis [Hymenobacter luteus]|uniref:Glycosyltransferase involved in cell wall biosynthesis n=2 Tax=Hymenobacter TaxID=89966 RepID=A0A7W9T1P9_9BACT|nr:MULTISPECIES: glycosyltransferase family 4 protein [Hymenobacter]MBB4600619.1 glycosyltransferase involved in cell wall biosynthesis [Hymenobacter latericoloratus]MBB6059174.1 glycosyltransferase involved in cell wall biosynthesis [Hymenobacter luteus]
MKKPLILVVDNSRAVTGALNAMRHATGPLREQFQFEYVVPTRSTARAVLEQDGYAVHELPFTEISRRKADLLLYGPMLLLNGWRLFRLAQQRGASIIHLNDFYNLTGYVAKILSWGRVRVVTHVRFLPQSLVQPLARTWRWLGERFADRVLCVSEAVRRYFGPSAGVQVVFDPIPGVERYPPPLVPASRPDNTVQLLYLSNYIQGKGQNFALEAFRQAYTHNRRLRLTFAGGDMGLEKNREFRQQLEAAAQNQGLAGVVTFRGFVADVEQAIKGADILLNFSESESFSLTCLDALYFGTPLIATDCGGPAELFENGVSGLLVPNRDVAAMAAAIRALAADRDKQTRFAAAGRRYVRHKFRPEATYGQLAQVYTAVLATARRKKSALPQ